MAAEGLEDGDAFKSRAVVVALDMAHDRIPELRGVPMDILCSEFQLSSRRSTPGAILRMTIALRPSRIRLR